MLPRPGPLSRALLVAALFTADVMAACTTEGPADQSLGLGELARELGELADALRERLP